MMQRLLVDNENIRSLKLETGISAANTKEEKM